MKRKNHYLFRAKAMNGTMISISSAGAFYPCAVAQAMESKKTLPKIASSEDQMNAKRKASTI